MIQSGPPQDLPPTLPRRQGPRPLPLHLHLLLLSCLTSLPAWALSKTGSLPWSGEVARRAAALRPALDAAAPDAFAAALDRAARRRIGRFMTAVQLYRRHPYRRDLPDMPVLWRQDETRLLDYGAGQPADAPVLLAVPSLVNRSYILDLAADSSFLRWLPGAGIHPLLVDWGRPGPVERHFTLTDYIAGPLEAALQVAVARAGRPVHLLGYCMGGLLALAVALRRPDLVASLILFATPWDFHTDRAHIRRLTPALPMLTALADQWGELPVDILQMLFSGLDPLLSLRKFDRFGHLPPSSPQARSFVALEDWANDGVALAGPVARECLQGWYGTNSPAQGRWRVAGRPVRPEDWPGPALTVVPLQDRIVPPASALALAGALPGAAKIEVPLGHISMMVSTRAPATVWQPVADWLHALV